MMLLISRHKMTILTDTFVLFTFLFQAGEVWLGKVGEVREIAADGATQVPQILMLYWIRLYCVVLHSIQGFYIPSLVHCYTLSLCYLGAEMIITEIQTSITKII